MIMARLLWKSLGCARSELMQPPLEGRAGWMLSAKVSRLCFRALRRYWVAGAGSACAQPM